MIVMEGLMLCPPERGSIIGRASWKVCIVSAVCSEDSSNQKLFSLVTASWGLEVLAHEKPRRCPQKRVKLICRNQNRRMEQSYTSQFIKQRCPACPSQPWATSNVCREIGIICSNMLCPLSRHARFSPSSIASRVLLCRH